VYVCVCLIANILCKHCSRRIIMAMESPSYSRWPRLLPSTAGPELTRSSCLPMGRASPWAAAEMDSLSNLVRIHSANML
jgi:hypothetical protein